MNPNDIAFDENYEMYPVVISEQAEPVTLAILDSLSAADELLQDEYKKKL